MKNPAIQTDKITGIKSEELPLLQKKYGPNLVQTKKNRLPVKFLKSLLTEPMFLCLLLASILYLILNSPKDAITMMIALLIISAISIYEDVKSEKAINALKEFTDPLITVIRNSIAVHIPVAEVLPTDIILLQEGDTIPADAEVLISNDLTANESILTGESFPVTKSARGDKYIYQGTTINSGSCTARVTQTGEHTQFGKLKKTVHLPDNRKTLMQQQTRSIMYKLATAGLGSFVIIFVKQLLHTNNVIISLLSALTIAMVAIPEEIPVAFSSFMALGAYQMSKSGIICKKPQVIEDLGIMTYLCLDKTGTLTENRMDIAMVYNHRTGLLSAGNKYTSEDYHLLHTAYLASEASPYDQMDKVIHQYFSKFSPSAYHRPPIIHEYNLEGTPPMMTHVYQVNGHQIATAKGAAERILHVCKLVDERVTQYLTTLGEKGYRVLGVASASANDHAPFPEMQDDWKWEFDGLIAFQDPIRQEAPFVIKTLSEAGIKTLLLTGDHKTTAISLAKQAGISHTDLAISGNEILGMNYEEIYHRVQQTSVYYRMFPDAKLKVINTLRHFQEITGMTGDGVNDAPALKSAHIGIAMGKKGSDIARQAADLVITDDNLNKLPLAVEQGRKININLRKAIRYIISIHIPIIIIVTLPTLLNLQGTPLLMPIHIITLELMMTPICSIFYEKEPVDPEYMKMPPRGRKKSLLSGKEILISSLLGIMIAAGVLIVFYYYLPVKSLPEIRTMVFTTLLSANSFLTFSNRSFNRSIFHILKVHNPLTKWVVIFTMGAMVTILFVPQVIAFFNHVRLSFPEIVTCIGIAFASVAWFEIYKIVAKNRAAKYLN